MKRYIYSLLSFVLVFVILLTGFQSLNQATIKNQKESLNKALNRGILECYVLEGSYPQSLDDLIKNYHIVYDKQLFEVKYEIIASNIKPDITIIEK